MPGTPTTGAAVINFLVIGLVLALVNSIIKPVAKIVAFPLHIVSFGLFAFVINGLMLLLASHVTGSDTMNNHLAKVLRRAGVRIRAAIAAGETLLLPHWDPML